MLKAAPFLALGLLTACMQTDFAYHLIDPVSSELRVSTRADNIEVVSVSLPLYASLEEIGVAAGDGAVRFDEQNLWADDPERALSLSLARHMTEITGGVAAVEPWPLTSVPDARLTVQVERVIARPGGTVEFSGVYVLSPVAEEFADRAEQFSFAVPMVQPGFGGVADAHGQAMLVLAEQVARQLP
ncbi:MAG: PqiC family protein [Pseudomonadota bacterium]